MQHNIVNNEIVIKWTNYEKNVLLSLEEKDGMIMRGNEQKVKLPDAVNAL